MTCQELPVMIPANDAMNVGGTPQDIVLRTRDPTLWVDFNHEVKHCSNMEQTSVPTRAYDLLEPLERLAVDEYVKFACAEQYRKRERIAYALDLPIPSEYVRRSKGILAKPLARAAVAEKLQEAANEQDISPDRVIQEHGVIAFSNIADYITVQPFGEFTVKNLKEIPRHLLGAIKSMKTVPSPYGIRTEITLHDKQQSLKVLTELMGLVAPDKPPVLGDYAKPPAAQKALTQDAPEAAYVELLESGHAGHH